MDPKSMHERILVVGGSLAGLRTVQALQREGHVGPVAVIGAEKHWPPYDRPPLSKQVLLGSIDPDRARLRVPDVAGLRVRTCCRATALDLDRQTVTVDDGSLVEYDRLVIATGADAHTLPGMKHLDGTHVLRTLEDSLRLRADLHGATRVAIVGAGFIGCEVASACRAMGIPVSVIDQLAYPLPPLGDTIGGYLATVMRDQGVDLNLGRRVTRLVGADRVEGVELDDGSRVDADVVVVGIGVRTSTDWLQSSGLTISDGVVCDSACLALGGNGQVSAVGDVARWEHPRLGSIRVEHWTNVTEQASHAARALLFGPAQAGPFSPVPYFWSDQFGLKLQLVGFCQPDQPVLIVEGSLRENRFVAAYVTQDKVDAVLCVNMPRRLAEWQGRLGSPEPVPVPVPASS